MSFLCHECHRCKTALQAKDVSDDRFSMDVLYVHDEILFLDVLSSVIKKHFRKFYTSPTAREAFEIFRIHFPQVLVLDKYWLSNEDIGMIEAARALNPDCCILLITAMPAPDVRNQIHAVTKLLVKPISVIHFLGVMKCVSRWLVSQRKELASSSA